MTPSARRMLESLLGLAVGDALGLPHEGAPMQPELAVAPMAVDGPRAHWTDDTQMALSVVDVLLDRGEIDQDLLARRFGERYEAFRMYGTGMHRLLPLLRDGADWRGHAHTLFGGGSFGNGSAMRIAPLGAFFAEAPVERVAEQARLSAEVTHAHPEGLAGAVAVAVAAWLAARSRDGRPPSMRAWFDGIEGHLDGGPEVRRGVERARDLPADTALPAAVAVLGNGSRVTCQDTVPLALWIARRHIDDFRGGVQTAIASGGDADTLAAMVGGILAARLGDEAIPVEWREVVEPLPPPFALG